MIFKCSINVFFDVALSISKLMGLFQIDIA
ncbi:Uncharacterised protein [Vibrio cholerae]|nr:Uncharacterised protein [Vibrio cholerae]